MFRKIAVALIATSMLAAPALAKTKNTPATPAATQPSTANAAAKPEGKPAATLKVKRHRHYAGHYRHHRHNMHAGKHRVHVYAGKHRNHVRHIVTTKPDKVVKFTTAPKHRVQIHRTVKVKKPIKTHRTAAIKPALPMGAKANRS